jgi:hypothetical protein
MLYLCSRRGAGVRILGWSSDNSVTAELRILYHICLRLRSGKSPCSTEMAKGASAINLVCPIPSDWVWGHGVEPEPGGCGDRAAAASGRVRLHSEEVTRALCARCEDGVRGSASVVPMRRIRSSLLSISGRRRKNTRFRIEKAQRGAHCASG